MRNFITIQLQNMNIRFIVILLFICNVTLHSQLKKTITHEEMWLMKRVGSPALSPDGKWVIFSVMDPSYNDKEQVNDIWIASTDQSATPRRLTAMKAGESSYSWSPDGQFIAFVAKRDGDEESQIYVLNMANGGEAQKLTTLSSGAGNPQWRKDGKAILFSSNVYPQCFTDSLQQAKAKEQKDLKYKVRVYESFPIRNWDKWIDEKQTYLFVQHIDSTKAKCIFTDVKQFSQAGFKYNSASWAGLNDVIFSATVDANTGAYQHTTSHIFKVGINGGEATQLTNKPNFTFAAPKLSENENYLYCMENKNEYSVYSMSQLVRFDYPSMANKIAIAPNLDRQISSFTDNAEHILINYEDKGRDKIVKVSNSDITQLTKSEIGCYKNLTYENGVMVATYESITSPPEIVKINADGTHTFITSFNKKKLESLDLNEPETFWTTTSKGKSIRSMLIKPAKFDTNKKYPLFVLMHGGPAISYKEEWGYRWNPLLLADTNLVIVLTDYTGSTGYGEQFTKDIINDPFRGPANEINEAAADAIKRYKFIDANKQAAGGASYGGHLANWMQATTTHYKCLISHAGLVNSVSQWSTSDYIYGREIMNGGIPWGDSKTWKDQNPFTYAEQFKTPMLLTVGEQDFRVPLNNTIENWHIHQRLKVPSKLIVFPEENHWVLKGENSKFMYKEIKEWLAKWLN